jgi:hypothetical protein
MKQDISKKVEQALNSLDGIKRAEPSPFFYTRVMGRLQRKVSGWEAAGSYLARPIVVVAGLVAVLVLNAAILLRLDQNTSAGTNSVANEQLVTDNEYILASSSSFDYENILK